MTWALWFQLLTLIITAGFMLGFIASAWRRPAPAKRIEAVPGEHRHRASCHDASGNPMCGSDE